ncbi:hypothetical protein L7F22_051992 [Adiantum nelumboides]|nr:hypothetical protein [Adiantum nelumboides]
MPAGPKTQPAGCLLEEKRQETGWRKNATMVCAADVEKTPMLLMSSPGSESTSARQGSDTNEEVGAGAPPEAQEQEGQTSQTGLSVSPEGQEPQAMQQEAPLGAAAESPVPSRASSSQSSAPCRGSSSAEGSARRALAGDFAFCKSSEG